jgi:selenocysteine-specific elongation factor
LGGFDCALLVIADDDDPVPETREYLAILDPLGVSESAVAITKVDRTSRASGAVAALLSASRLAGARLFPAPGISGAGLPARRRHLEVAAGRVKQ